jgi:threonine dehydratase
VSDAVEGAGDVAGAVTETVTETAGAATETAVETATEMAGAATDVLSGDGFDFAKVSEMIDGSSLDALKKAALKTAVEQAQNNPDLLKTALDSVKAALGM